MLISSKAWNKIRDQFTEGEKEQLRAGVTGVSICPDGVVVDVDFLPSHLREKLVDKLSDKDGVLQ